MKNKRKTDRRTVYTINAIKKAFLKLIEQNSYSQINVTSLCREAEITRSTFYLHFDNLTDVLNEVLDEALLFSNTEVEPMSFEDNPSIDVLKENESLLPACQRVADSPKYHHLLMDPSLSDYIIGRIIKHEKSRTVPSIQKRTGLSKSEAELLFIYAIHGSFAINKKHHFVKDEAWYHDLQLLNKFTSGGYKVISSK
ncbi:TetR/AcrR family transcriptional regulator [Companilactobacillus halodurans]|uniref:TetR/AcrR family transcriptional regulator n=1 Tax=Companilactobacillus halodurans TaxID=2584183 RepID=A0A5P0ZPD8_9LACO|nr:TetR/AcrR family transcriptional regulator [Companilactobacillus halodurans]MQS76076.1 TetR/AcrR family transcriptional regulator [Companilactobacillus halodurans]MQS96512.1 TetR/AcrR family transcriptional regulator [Companilactobacillus halodurans]